ncbi:hypothetical protein [Variovorax paradoxus]|uniref:hypothetical protein n=1 Tax=Variovorax paradoxus TaxID=34073 RepID=UPI001932DABA|nr:hypothetical protein INQ48_43615 [Variovorax paradoxus]
MSASTRTVVFTAQLRIGDVEALRAAAAMRAVQVGLTAQEWTSMRSGSSDDVVMLLDPGSIAAAGLEIIQSRCEILDSEAVESQKACAP